MSWMQAMEIVTKHWIEQLCALVVAVLTWLYNKKLKHYASDQKAIRLGMLA